jgi:hypothetical protein
MNTASSSLNERLIVVLRQRGGGKFRRLEGCGDPIGYGPISEFSLIIGLLPASRPSSAFARWTVRSPDPQRHLLKPTAFGRVPAAIVRDTRFNAFRDRCEAASVPW